MNEQTLKLLEQLAQKLGTPAETIYCVSVLSKLALTVISVIISITLITDAINSLFNPQYWALQQILATVK